MSESKKKINKNAFFMSVQYLGVLLFVLTVILIFKDPRNTQAEPEVLGVQITTQSLNNETEKFSQLEIVDVFPGYAEVVIDVERMVSPVGAEICIENSDGLDIQGIECMAPFACMDNSIDEGKININAIVPLESVDKKSNGKIAIVGIFYNSINKGKLTVNTQTCGSTFYVAGYENSILKDSLVQYNVNSE